MIIVETDKAALMDKSLMRAAESIGDITAPTVARFYQAFPEARASFVHHGPRKVEKLEAEMVEAVLHCIMTWFESPAETWILLEQSTIHHMETLDVSLDWFKGLFDATVDTIVQTIPMCSLDERRLWQEIRTGLSDLIDEVVALNCPGGS